MNLSGSLLGTQVAKQLGRDGAAFCGQGMVVPIIAAAFLAHPNQPGHPYYGG
jgi:hypothetical protein